MKRQKSFESDHPKLYIVATPIGNLSEMTPRAIEILNEVDVIACEDTRHSSKMLKHFNIKTKLISHQKFNESESVKGILMLLHQGMHVALISDAGYPLISDPGHELVNAVIHHGYNVIPVSGSSALLNALVASGLVTQPFYFHGFLPNQQKELIGVLTRIRHYQATLIFYESPHRIAKTLKHCLELLGDRKAVLVRELTKLHEEFLRGTLSELVEQAVDLKGEMVLIVDKDEGTKLPDMDLNDVYTKIEEFIAQGFSAKDAISEVAKLSGYRRKQVYELYHTKRC
ncbi:MAG: 16S rRNA (cytidine(1402)-2'-O)-methyltransferase [Erysipelothrix sp.]|jgi:16S rRNA (cytidine1402-2'-O)-methyltransferase|nr:16S rRNA (cytidine(1402)-2'-O)-methyltransferase [Erysipelothrix sp.]